MSSPKGTHSWTKASRLASKRFSINFERNKKTNGCILLLGVTGSGKSSICKILGCNAIVGHGSKSKTQENRILKSNMLNYTFIDTMGTEDSNNKWDDEQIMKDILKQCFEDGIINVKIIWTISNDTTRCQRSFQRAAKLINSLGTTVWDNVIIIIKNGSSSQPIGGIIEAIQRQNSRINIQNIKKRCFGISCIENEFEPSWEKKEIYNSYLELNKDPKKVGIYTKNQYINLLKTELNKLNEVKINWDIKSCKNCTEIGDPRFISSQCHYKELKYHINPVKYHSGSLCHKHTGRWEKITVSKDTIYDSVNEFGKNSLGLGWAFYAHPVTHAVRMFQSNTQEVYRWSCCFSTTENNTECKHYCSNCNNDWSGTFCDFKCGNCGVKYDPSNNTNGCQSKCTKCDKKWKTTLCVQEHGTKLINNINTNSLNQNNNNGKSFYNNTSVWVCNTCTFRNKNMKATKCKICFIPRINDQQSVNGNTKSQSHKTSKKKNPIVSTWACTRCTFPNKMNASKCKLCFLQKDED